MHKRIYLQTKEEFDRESAFLQKKIAENSGLEVPDFKVRKVIEIKGDLPENALAGLCGYIYSQYTEIASTERATFNRSVTVLLRPGRTDEVITEIRDILKLYTDISQIEIRVGKEYIFPEKLPKSKYEALLPYLFNPQTEVVSDEETEEAELPSEDKIATEFNSDDYTALNAFKEKYELEMDIDDMMCIQNYFLSESRQPTFAEINIIDRFFSEDFRHTTFETILDSVECFNPAAKTAWEHYIALNKNNPRSLSNIAKIAADKIKFSSQKNSSHPDEFYQNPSNPKIKGIKITNDSGVPLLISLKNESRNRSASADPYSGASCCLASNVRSILCKLGYVYDSYRASGSENKDKSERAFSGYADLACKIGVPCSRSNNIISDAYSNKQLEINACLSVSDLDELENLSATHADPGDIIFIIGSETGKDGPLCLKLPDADAGKNIKGEYIPVAQSGDLNALSRLLTRKDTAKIIKAINHIGSGGIACSIGEIASGSKIYSERVPLKYSGLSVSEILLSSSHERMIVCVSPENKEEFENICKTENVLCSAIAEVDDSERFTVYSHGVRMVSLTRELLISGGTEKHLSAIIEKPEPIPESKPLQIARVPLNQMGAFKKIFSKEPKYDLKGAFCKAASYLLNTSSSEYGRFDVTAGGNEVFPPYSTKVPSASVKYVTYNGNPVTFNNSKICTALSFGVKTDISLADPFRGSYLSVTDAKLKLITSGYYKSDAYLVLQEYLPEHRNNSKQLGVAVASMLGAHEAQINLNMASLGGKLSISSPQNEKHSTVAAFATCIGTKDNVITSDFKKSGSSVVIFIPEYEKNGILPLKESQLNIISSFTELADKKQILSSTSVTSICPATAIIYMCRASGLGFKFNYECTVEQIFDNCYGAIIAEIPENSEIPKDAVLLGKVSGDYYITYQKEDFPLPEILGNKDNTSKPREKQNFKNFIYLKTPNDNYGENPTVSGGKVHVLMPVSKHNSAIYDIKHLYEAEGAEVEIFAFDGTRLADFSKAIDRADIIYLADSNGYPAYITAVLSIPEISVKLDKLRRRGGLIYGVGSAVETLIKANLLDIDPLQAGLASNPEITLINSNIKIRSCSLLSPFMRLSSTGAYYDSFITGRRLRLLADENLVSSLAFHGRIAVQYDEYSNLLGCTHAIDAITSIDGRVFGQLSRPDKLSSVSEFYKALPVIKSGVKFFKSN